MTLLIVTQRVDRTHPVLGFFHRWIQEFASQYQSVTVIAQIVGPYDFPPNVRVFSLGKENGASRLRQIISFWRLISLHQREYDAVFVHMTPIWVVIGWPVWSIKRKPISLWYEARGARWPLRVALLMVRRVFSASVAGMPLRTAKSMVTGHGIDTDIFTPDNTVDRLPNQLIHVGRITASKHIPELLECVAQLPHTRLLLLGAAVTSADETLLASVHQRIDQADLRGRVEIRSVPPAELPGILQRADLFIHASETSLDKAVLEAMACECLVVSAASAFRDVLPDVCRSDLAHLTDAVSNILSLPLATKTALRHTLRTIVQEHHSLVHLIHVLSADMSSSLHV